MDSFLKSLKKLEQEGQLRFELLREERPAQERPVADNCQEKKIEPRRAQGLTNVPQPQEKKVPPETTAEVQELVLLEANSDFVSVQEETITEEINQRIEEPCRPHWELPFDGEPFFVYPNSYYEITTVFPDYSRERLLELVPMKRAIDGKFNDGWQQPLLSFASGLLSRPSQGEVELPTYLFLADKEENLAARFLLQLSVLFADKFQKRVCLLELPEKREAGGYLGNSYYPFRLMQYTQPEGKTGPEKREFTPQIVLCFSSLNADFVHHGVFENVVGVYALLELGSSKIEVEKRRLAAIQKEYPHFQTIVFDHGF